MLATSAVFTLYWLKASKSKLSAEAPPTEESATSGNPPTRTSQPKQNQSIPVGKERRLPAVAEKLPYQMSSSMSAFDPIADANRRENAPFKIQGHGSKAKIVDKEGKILIEADENIGFYGCSVSPNGKQIAVYYGDATYDIINFNSGETIRLPQQPPGDNMLGFGSWHWINDKTLIGVSGIIAPHNHEHTGHSCEDPHISQSVLYRYDLNEQKISQIALPPGLDTKIVSVRAVDETGKVQLWPDGQGDSYTDASLGWFEIRPTE